MARKNNFDTITNLLENEVVAHNQQSLEAAQKYDYANALHSQIIASTFSRALSMINACKPKGKEVKYDNNILKGKGG